MGGGVYKGDQNYKIYEKGLIKPKLSYLEFQVCSHCNLKCKGCGAFSNYAEEEYADLKQYKEDLVRLSEIFSGVERIHLMGGEPFLNPQVGEFAEVTREVFEDCDCRIVTNGILIGKVPEETLIKLRECNAIISITEYLPTASMKDKIEERLRRLEVNYEFRTRVTQFFKNKNIAGTEDKDKAFEKCFRCYALKNGILAQCGLPIHAKHNFKKYFDFEFMEFEPDRDYIDLYTTKLTGEEINKLFSSSKEFCRFCKIHDPEFYDWKITDKEIPDIYDWSV